jgi:hypothetical protein
MRHADHATRTWPRELCYRGRDAGSECFTTRSECTADCIEQQMLGAKRHGGWNIAERESSRKIG